MAYHELFLPGFWDNPLKPPFGGGHKMICDCAQPEMFGSNACMGCPRNDVLLGGYHRENIEKRIEHLKKQISDLEKQLHPTGLTGDYLGSFGAVACS
jgi:hypothetical protein